MGAYRLSARGVPPPFPGSHGCSHSANRAPLQPQGFMGAHRHSASGAPPLPQGLMGAHTLPMELHSHPFQQLFSLAVLFLFLETGCQTGCHAPYSGLLILLPLSPGVGIADVASCPSATSLLSDFCHCPCLWHGCNWMYPICTHISGLSRLCCF